MEDTRQSDPFEFGSEPARPAPAPPPPSRLTPPAFVAEESPVPVLSLDEIRTLSAVPADNQFSSPSPVTVPMGAAVPTTQIQPEPDPVSVRAVLNAPLDDPLEPSVASSRESQVIPTPAELRAEAKLQRVQRYQQQERIRAPKVQIDQRVVLVIWIAGILTAFVSSAIVSYNGITAVAEFVGLSETWMSGLFFFFIELMYLLFLIAYLVLASRVDDEGRKEKTLGAITGMFAFGAVAVAANAFHTFEFWKYDWIEPRMWAGVVLSVAAPLAIISASKMASRVVFAKAIVLD